MKESDEELFERLRCVSGKTYEYRDSTAAAAINRIRELYLQQRGLLLERDALAAERETLRTEIKKLRAGLRLAGWSEELILAQISVILNGDQQP